MSFLAIDIGGTYIKSARVVPENITLANAFRTPIPPFKNSDQGHCEIDLNLLRESLNRHFEYHSMEPIEGLLMTHQMHGFVLVDREGYAISDYFSWQDQRGNSEFKHVISQLDEAIFDDLGKEIKPGYPVILLSYLSRQGFNLRDLTPLSLGDWLATELCSKNTRAFEKSNASAFGIYDCRNNTINLDLIKNLHLDYMNWPDLKDEFACVGFGQHKKIAGSFPVFIAQGDQQIALAGALYRDTQTICLNIATGSQCSQLTESFATGPFQLRPYFNNSFLKTQTHIPAGRAVNRILSFFGAIVSGKLDDNILAKLDLAAFEIDHTDLIVKLGFFEGAYEKEGLISGLNDINMTPANFYLACLSNIAQNHFEAAKKMNSTENCKKVLVAGGFGQKSKTLQKLIKSLFTADIVFPPFPEDTLVGLLIKATLISKSEKNWFTAMDLIKNENLQIK